MPVTNEDVDQAVPVAGTPIRSNTNAVLKGLIADIAAGGGGGGSGDVTKVGTPANNQVGVWTGDGTLEGASGLTFDSSTDTLNVGTSGKIGFGGVNVLSDSGGTTTLQNIDALDSTTESTIESAIDTLPNLTLIQGRTVALADAGADAIFGWDDSANQYANLTQADVRTAIFGDSLADPNADRILFWDDSAGSFKYLAPGSGLTITGTTIDAAGAGGYPARVDVPTGSAYTLLAADTNKIHVCADSSAQTINITSAFNGCGGWIQWLAGAGTVTLDAAADVNLNGLGLGASVTFSAGAGMAQVIPTGTNTFNVVGAIGDLVASDITNLATGVSTFLTTTPTSATLATLIGGDLAVVDGGTGRSTGATAYGLIAAGTTATGAQQTLAAGATTEILVGGGASALPVWTTASGTGAPLRQTGPTITSPVVGLGTPGTDDTYNGIAISSNNAGATIAQWEAVYMGATFEWLLADANGSGTFPAMGLAVSSGTDNNPLTVLVRGVARNDAWNWSVGLIYLSETAGGLTQTAPTASTSKVQIMGYALSADTMFVCPSLEYLTLT